MTLGSGTLGSGTIGGSAVSADEDEEMRTWTPPRNPVFPYPVERIYPRDRFQTAKGYDSAQKKAIRPIQRVGPLTWDGLTFQDHQAIVSFFDAVHGEAFKWTPLHDVPTPSDVAPVLSEVAGGALGARTYYVVFTWHDATYGETTQSARASIAVQANFFLKVEVPVIPSGVAGWRVYVSETSGAEELQATVTDGRSWTQSGSLISGASPPASNTLRPLLTWQLDSELPSRRVTAVREQLAITLLEQHAVPS